MGNYASCALAGATRGKAVKVVFPDRKIRTFAELVSAAELMLEMPNFFVVNSGSLEIGRRFSPLNADAELLVGNVYVLFPMKKLNSLIGNADMDVLCLVANKKSKSKSKVVPLIQAVEEEEEEICLPEMGHRRSKSRSKKPDLETILEEPMWVS